MAPFRKERMSRIVRDVVAETIAHELNDPRMDAMTTVTRVEMSPDLMVARVFLSVRGDDKVERRVIGAVRHAAGFIQRRVAHELTVRSCPELRFDIDERIKGTARIMRLIEDNRSREPEEFVPDGDVDDDGAVEDIEGHEEECSE